MLNLNKIIVLIISICIGIFFVFHDVSAWQLPPVIMKNHSLDQVMYMNYAYQISGQDKEFLYLLKNENGLISPDRRHDPSNNVVGVDWGFCGINDYWHKDVVNDPNFFNWRWQLEKCYYMYKSGVTFYGKGKGYKVKHFFNFR